MHSRQLLLPMKCGHSSERHKLAGCHIVLLQDQEDHSKHGRHCVKALVAIASQREASDSMHAPVLAPD
eukprot:2410496-Amphidinium_carterae.1